MGVRNNSYYTLAQGPEFDRQLPSLAQRLSLLPRSNIRGIIARRGGSGPRGYEVA